MEIRYGKRGFGRGLGVRMAIWTSLGQGRFWESMRVTTAETPTAGDMETSCNQSGLPVDRGVHPEAQAAAGVGEDVGQGEHSSIVGGSANWCNHSGNQFGSFSGNWE